MPAVLKDLRKTTTISLPSFADSKVVIYDSFLLHDIYSVGLESGSENVDPKNYPEFIVRLIKEWDFVDDKGAKMPVTAENIKILPTEDLTFIIEKWSEFAYESKKK